MLVERFYVPSEEVGSVGLHEINMRRLGRYVAIAGKNGSGKTRLLNQLQNFIVQRKSTLPQLPAFRQNLENTKNACENDKSSPYLQTWGSQIEALSKQIEVTTNRVVGDRNKNFDVMRFVPKSLQLDDHRHRTDGDIKMFSEKATEASVESFSGVCVGYIKKKQDRWWNSVHQHSMATEQERHRAISEYESLKNGIEELLGVPPSRDLDNCVTLFNKPVAEAALSDGQLVLLQLAVALHAQQAKLDSTVVILDEPENHLHPAAVIEVLNRIVSIAPSAQIWIATHSVPLLAHVCGLEPMSLWFMEKGKIENAGRHPERVLKDLLGDENGIAQLHRFTGLPAELARTNYAAECLFSIPTPVPHVDDADPQVNQIRRIISTLKTKSIKELAILDFGAGQGRLLAGLASEGSLEKVKERIDYFAFDTSVSFGDACCAVIADVYGSSEGRFFGSEKKFFETKDDASVDVIVMCNVLHEIPPSEWVSLFGKSSLIGRSLREDGYLLIVEDQYIPVGENAHNYGFIVLDTDQLRILLSVKAQDIADGLFIAQDARGDGRLKAHLVSKKLLSRISGESRTRQKTAPGQSLEGIF